MDCNIKNMLLQVKKIEELEDQYTRTINRAIMWQKIVPALSAELTKWKGKKFNIKTGEALGHAAIAVLPGATVNAYKSQSWNGKTCYVISVIPKDWRFDERFEITNRNDSDQDPFTAFSDQLSRYDQGAEVETKARALLASLPSRHADAKQLVTLLEPFDDILTI